MIAPSVSPRLLFIRSGSTPRPSSTTASLSSRPAVRIIASGTAIHSSAHAPMSRSFACAADASSTVSGPRSSRADAITYSQIIGFRFCGIVDEPTESSVAGSQTSATSVDCSRTISAAIRSAAAPISASACTRSRNRSRAACHGTAGSARSRRRQKAERPQPRRRRAMPACRRRRRAVRSIPTPWHARDAPRPGAARPPTMPPSARRSWGRHADRASGRRSRWSHDEPRAHRRR